MSAALERALDEARCILFVCTGNMVRSAFAELYASQRGCPLPVRSAATLYRNDHLFPETARALEIRGVPVERTRAFRPTHLDDLAGTLEAPAVAFGMTARHLEALAVRTELPCRAFRLAELLGAARDIRDPVLEGADFDQTFREIERCVDALIERLLVRGRRRGGAGAPG